MLQLCRVGAHEMGEMTLTALAQPELEQRRSKKLRKQLKWIASMLANLAELDYRTGDIKQFSAASTQATR